MQGRLLSWLAVIAFALGATPARPCSTVEGYVPPSSFELVQLADAIAIGTPIRTAGDFALTFRIESAVEGTPPALVHVPFTTFGERQSIGMCTRSAFTRGSRYVLFLTQDEDGDWRALDFPYARNIDDYAGEDSEWIRTVRRYLRLKRDLPPMEQIAALRQMLVTGRDRHGSALSVAERYDIVDHLSAITPLKPTEWLLDLHERIERGEPPPFPPRAYAYGPAEMERAVAAFLDDAPPATRGDLSRRRLEILRALATGEHRGALPLFERLDALPQLDARSRGLVLRYFANHGDYGRSWRWIETRLLTELQLLPRSEALALLLDVAEVQRGDSAEEGQERWRADAGAAARWPEVALALYWHQVRTVGRDDAILFLDAIDEVEIADYRARPELTLALGDTFDEEVERWAMAELARPAPMAVAGADESVRRSPSEDLLPLRVLVSSWHEDRVAALQRAYCDGGERRRLVILALGQWGDWMYEGLLASMAATQTLTAEERGWLVRAAVEMTARDIRESGESTYFGDEEDWLLTEMIRSGTASVSAISCPAPR